MSWYLSDHLTRKPLPFMRLSTMHKSVSIGLLCSVGTAVILPVAQAATVGKTIVTSIQHQPLAASISVTGIRSADFSASLADPVIYQQMGLIPTASMSAQFLPLSADTGVVVVNSIQPIAMPFTDVVLAINDQGQRQIIPKTLLLPLVNSKPIEQTPSTSATKKTAPSTLIVNAHTARPLVVKRVAPPVRANTDSIDSALNTNKTTAKPVNKTPALSESKTKSPQILVASRQAPPPLFSSPKPVEPTLKAAEPIFNASQAIDLPINTAPRLSDAKTKSNVKSKTESPQILVASRQAPPSLFSSPKPVELILKTAEPIFNASQATNLPTKNASQATNLTINKIPRLTKSNAKSNTNAKTESPQILVASRQAPPPLFSSPKPVEPTLKAAEPIFNASQATNLPTKNVSQATNLTINKIPRLTKSNANAKSNAKTESPQILVASRQAPPPLFASPKLQSTALLAQSKLPDNTLSISERSVNSIANVQPPTTVDNVMPLTAVSNKADASINPSINPVIELTSIPKGNHKPLQGANRSTSHPSLSIQVSRKITATGLDFSDAITSTTLSAKDSTHKPLVTPSTSLEESAPSYIVQKNDNLWVISQQIAKQNNLDILIVMEQIKSQNLNAFINKNSNHLKIDAALDLSSYDSIPTQESLQTAIADKRQQSLESFKRV